jgi:tRNA-specific 2-thiouridylase
VECNRSVKFSQLLAHSRELGCDLLVTGHYARVDRQGERRRLLRGVDRAKDQSYVLYMLGQEELARVRFPVGELRKAETRRIAADLGLRTAHKAESQDICFVGGGDYRGFLRREAPEALAPGPIADLSGRRVGSHQGIASFTIGQRRGLGVAVGEARFVVGIEPGTATVTIGRREDLLVEGMEVEGLTWVAGHPPPDGAITVKVRYHSDPVAADITGSAVRFDRPQGSVSPGQAAVFYQGDELLGGGTIARTYRVGRGL